MPSARPALHAVLQIVRVVISHARSAAALWLGVAILVVFDVAVALVVPFALGRVVAGTGGALAFVAVASAQVIAGGAHGALGRAAASTTATSLRCALEARLFRLSFAAHQRRRTWETVAETLESLQRLEEWLATAPAAMLRGPTLLIGAMIALARTDGVITAMIGAGAFGIAILVTLFSRAFAGRAAGVEASRARATAALGTSLEAVETVYAYGAAAIEQARTAAALGEAARRVRSLAFVQGAASSMVGIAAFALLGAVMAYGVRLVHGGALSGAALVSMFALLFVIQSAIGQLANAAVEGQIALGAAAQALSSLREDAHAPALPPESPLSRVDRGGFTLHRVHYGDGDAAVLTDVSMHLRRGEICVVMGPSGCGKTTLARVAVGLLSPTAGLVRRHAHRIAYVPQRATLFPASLRENVAYGPLAPCETAVEDALDAARLRDVVDAIPNGLDTLVGPGGHPLSGGQAQRVSLARALAQEPDLLVIDEGTSALDERIEDAVLLGLAAAKHRRATMIVTHRPAALRIADLVVRMESGRVLSITRHRPLAAGEAIV